MSLTKSTYKALNFISPLYGFFKNRRLRVLAYHTVPDPKAFEKQINYLKSNFTIISIEDLRNHLFKNKSLPEYPVLITFDDGDISVKENGLPLLKKHKLPSVMFVITSLVDTNKMFWCRQVEHVLQENGSSYNQARAKVIELKNSKNYKRVEFVNSLRVVKSPQLKKEDLLRMEVEGMFVANHTHTHPMIDNCNIEEVKEELYLSRICFENWGLNGYSVFAYPNGNWDTKNEELLKKEKIKMAFLFDHNINKIKINPMRISRLRVDADQHIDEFKVKVSGLHTKLMKIKNHFFN
jgi:poly-beta-1,6-N-acetyl-D-glucosamine N-deacetylase